MVTIRFTEGDFKKLVEDEPDFPFFSRGSGGEFDIHDEDTEKKVGHWSSKRQKLTLNGAKGMKWLKENSYI